MSLYPEIEPLDTGMLEVDQLLKGAGRLKGIPGVLVHGRYDISGPLTTPWELARAWPDAQLVIADRSGHSASDPEMSDALVAATDGFKPAGL